MEARKSIEEDGERSGGGKGSRSVGCSKMVFGESDRPKRTQSLACDAQRETRGSPEGIKKIIIKGESQGSDGSPHLGIQGAASLSLR